MQDMESRIAPTAEELTARVNDHLNNTASQLIDAAEAYKYNATLRRNFILAVGSKALLEQTPRGGPLYKDVARKIISEMNGILRIASCDDELPFWDDTDWSREVAAAYEDGNVDTPTEYTSVNHMPLDYIELLDVLTDSTAAYIRG